MKKQVSRTIELKNVIWLTDKKVPTLEKVLRDFWDICKLTNERIVERFDGTAIQGLQLIDYRNSGHKQKCIIVHFARFTEGQFVGTVSKGSKIKSTISTIPPPPNENYLEQDFLVLVKNNSVIMTSASVNKGAFLDFIKGMVDNCGFHDYYSMLDLVSVADGNKLKLIKMHGVKNIKLNMSISDVVLSQLNDVEKSGFKIAGLFTPLINSIAKKDKSLADYAKESESKVEILLKVKSGEIKSVREGVNKLATKIVSMSEDNDYLIELNNKDKLSLDSIKHRRTVNLKAMASTFLIDDAIDKMLQFFDDIENDGQI